MATRKCNVMLVHKIRPFTLANIIFLRVFNVVWQLGAKLVLTFRTFFVLSAMISEFECFHNFLLAGHLRMKRNSYYTSLITLIGFCVLCFSFNQMNLLHLQYGVEREMPRNKIKPPKRGQEQCNSNSYEMQL
jgi:hypothetical protein